MTKLSSSGNEDKYQLLIYSTPDFNNLLRLWEKVLEKRVRIIVGFPGSNIQFYPTHGKSENFGSVKVSTKETKNFSFYSMSKVEIVKQEIAFEIILRETIIIQFYPDYDVISSNNLFVWFTNKVLEIDINDQQSVVVFGGDTASGLFAAYNLLIRSNGNKIDIYDQVLNLRRINPKFFQNMESYALLHELLVEYFELGNTERGQSQIRSGISTRKEFDFLQKTACLVKRDNSFTMQGNHRTKVYATCVDNVEHFWSKILEKELDLIVSCDQNMTLAKLGLVNETSQNFGTISLHLGENFIEVKSFGMKHKVEMIFLDGSNWMKKSKKFQQLCDQFMRVVVIINDNEVTMLALSQLLNRFEIESKFDVYRQVKELGLEVTMEQYDTIYKCMLCHIQEENTYVNTI